MIPKPLIANDAVLQHEPRLCLKCRKLFLARGHYIRICPSCTAVNRITASPAVVHAIHMPCHG